MKIVQSSHRRADLDRPVGGDQLALGEGLEADQRPRRRRSSRAGSRACAAARSGAAASAGGGTVAIDQAEVAEEIQRHLDREIGGRLLEVLAALDHQRRARRLRRRRARRAGSAACPSRGRPASPGARPAAAARRRRRHCARTPDRPRTARRPGWSNGCRGCGRPRPPPAASRGRGAARCCPRAPSSQAVDQMRLRLCVICRLSNGAAGSKVW